MSRSGYVKEEDYDGQFALWRGVVLSAIRGKRGQAFLRDLVDALDAMPEKRLIAEDLVREELPPPMVRWLFAPPYKPYYRYEGAGIEWPHECGVCALGALGLKRGIDMTDLDPEDAETIGATFNIAHQLAREVVWMNDEAGPHHQTPEHRWRRMRKWAASLITNADDSGGEGW